MRYYTWIMLFFLFTSCTHHQAVKSNQRGMDYITREQPRKALEEFNHAISLDRISFPPIITGLLSGRTSSKMKRPLKILIT